MPDAVSPPPADNRGRWTNSRDGVMRINLRITHRLDIDELARLLRLSGLDHDDATLDDIRQEVRDMLANGGTDAFVDVASGPEDVTAVRRAFGAPS